MIFIYYKNTLYLFSLEITIIFDLHITLSLNMSKSAFGLKINNNIGIFQTPLS